MQKNDLTLRNQRSDEAIFELLTFSALTLMLSRTRLVKFIQDVYRQYGGIKFTAEETVYLLYAQFSVFAVVCPVQINMGWRALFLVFFVLAAKRSNVFRRDDEDELEE